MYNSSITFLPTTPTISFLQEFATDCVPRVEQQYETSLQDFWFIEAMEKFFSEKRLGIKKLSQALDDYLLALKNIQQ